jgi:hypothetical protein
MNMNKPVNERKPGKSRIMVQLWGTLAKSIDKHFKEMHIKRDGYLNDLLTLEIERLAEEVHFRNPDEVRQRLRDRPLPDRVKLNLELDLTLIDRMNEVLKERNIPRDSFVNRVLFFLVAKDSHLDYLNIDYDKNSPATAKPLSDAKGFLFDPFFHIRGANDEAFYAMPWFADAPFGKNGPNLFGLNTAINEETWSLMTKGIEDLFAELDAIPNKEASHATN